jgi:fatty acid desaturase
MPAECAESWSFPANCVAYAGPAVPAGGRFWYRNVSFLHCHKNWTATTVNAQPRIPREELERLRTFRLLPNLTKIPLFFGIMGLLTWFAWTIDSTALKWATYLALGYMWMGIVTFMHDATHNTLIEKKWKNWAFGIITMIPLMASFVAFKEDHLEHHRYNRSPDDPDAFTMG